MLPRTSQSIKTHKHVRNYKFLETMTGPAQGYEAIGRQIYELCRLAQKLENDIRNNIRSGGKV